MRRSLEGKSPAALTMRRRAPDRSRTVADEFLLRQPDETFNPMIPDSEPTLDAFRIASLRGSMTAAEFAMLKDLFLADMAKSLERLLAASAPPANRVAIARYSHGLKGCVSNFGATRLADIAQCLEQEAASAPEGRIADLVSQVVGMAGRVRGEFTDAKPG